MSANLRLKSCLALLLFGLTGCDSSNDRWTVGSPESLGFDPKRLTAFAERLGPLETDSLLVARRGEIALEWYAIGHGRRRKESLASVPKGLIGGLLLTAAVDGGHLGLDDEVGRYVESWRDDPTRSQVTVRQLATHTSGLENVGFAPGDDLSEVPRWQKVYEFKRDTRVESALERTGFLYEPGERFSYSGNGYYVLAYTIAKSLAAADQPDLREYYRMRILEPLGIPDDDWLLSYGESYSYRGTPVYAIGSGASFTTRAVARIGQMLLEDATWNGDPIFDRRYLDELLQAPAELPGPRELGVGHPQSGLGWYLNVDGYFPSLPRDAFLCAGQGFRIVLVVPSLELVFVRTGESFDRKFFSNAEAPFWLTAEEMLFAPLMATLEPPWPQGEGS